MQSLWHVNYGHVYIPQLCHLAFAAGAAGVIVAGTVFSSGMRAVLLAEPRVSKSVGSSHHANGSLESDWARMDLFEDNPLTAVVMEQDPHLPNIRLDAAFVQVEVLQSISAWVPSVSIVLV